MIERREPSASLYNGWGWLECFLTEAQQSMITAGVDVLCARTCSASTSSGGSRFLQWACLTFWQTWAPSLPTKLKWGNVYRRDRYRCISPVCDSRNITPHHMKYKSAGGTDDDENMGSVCHTEHLDLIHAFRSLRLYPPASSPTWVFGKDKTLFVVEGREKRAGDKTRDERATA
ncbi:MAG: HNH endonuclease [Polyangiales bacterium]